MNARRIFAVLIAVAGLTLVPSGFGTAWAQQADLYRLGPFLNANVAGIPTGTLRIANPGTQGAVSPGSGDLCANIYIFDKTQEMDECCSCKITPDGELILSLNGDLTANGLNGKVVHEGLVKVFSSAVPPLHFQSLLGKSVDCDPTIAGTAAEPLLPSLREWATHVTAPGGAAVISGTVEEYQSAFFGASELTDTVTDCGEVLELGSKTGVCNCPVDP